MDLLDDLCDRFLERYSDGAAVDEKRVALWEALDLLSAVLHCWTNVKFERLEPQLVLFHHRFNAGGIA